MEDTKELETVIIDGPRYSLFLWPFMFGGSMLSLVVAVRAHIPMVLWIGLGVFFVIPMVLNAWVRSFFTWKARLQFSPDRLVIQFINQKTDVVERTDEIAFDDVVNYRCLPAYKNNSFVFYLVLSDGLKVRYVFWPTRKLGLNVDVLGTLRSYIDDYNKRAPGGHVIEYRYRFNDPRPRYPKKNWRNSDSAKPS